MHPEDKQRAGAIWESLGQKNTCHGENEWVYFLDSLEYELHSRLMNDEAGNFPSHKTFMNQHWKYATCESQTVHFHLDWSYHFVFLLLHLRKHFINKGIGFRQFMDIAVVTQKCPLDWAWICSQLQTIGIFDFAQTVFALCNRWFEYEIPYSAVFDEQVIDDFSETIINNGVFGFTNPNNHDNYLKLQLQVDKRAKWKMLCESLFPSYSTMKTIDAYRFLNGKPLLLPFAWCYRWIRALFVHGFKESAAITAKGFSVSKKALWKGKRD